MNRLYLEGTSNKAVGKEAGVPSRKSWCSNELAGIERYSAIKRDRAAITKVMKCLCSPFAGSQEDFIPTSTMELLLVKNFSDTESALVEFATPTVTLEQFRKCINNGCLQQIHYNGEPGFRLAHIVNFTLRNFYPAQVIDRMRSDDAISKRFKRNGHCSSNEHPQPPDSGDEPSLSIGSPPQCSNSSLLTTRPFRCCPKHSHFDDDLVLHDFTTCRICGAEPIEGAPKRPTLVHKETCRSRERPELSTVITAAEEQVDAASSKLSSQIQREPASFGILLPAYAQSDRRKNSDYGSGRLMTLRRISSVPFIEGGGDELSHLSHLPSVKSLLAQEKRVSKAFLEGPAESMADWGLLQLPKVRESQRFSFSSR